ncbi:MAG: hypothetical protein ABIS21_00360 [Acidimicrobiales bacterium]
MRVRFVPPLAIITALALAGGCSSSTRDDTADPTVPTTTEETTTTAAPDPFAVPEVIDEAYVNKVLAALDQVDGEALRRVVTNGTVQIEVSSMVRAIYNDPQFEQELGGLFKVFAEGLEPFKNPPGNRRRTVTRFGTGSPECIFTEVHSDFSAVLKAPPPDPPGEVEIVTLRPTQTGADPENHNPTPWSVSNSEVIKTGEVPAERARCDP